MKVAVEDIRREVILFDKIFLHTYSGSRGVLTNLQFGSVSQLCPTLCDPMDCSMPGFLVHYQLPEPAQTHVHQVSDVIQLSHPLSSPSPPAFNLSQHQGLFQGVSSLHQVAKYWSFSLSIRLHNVYSGVISFRIDRLDLLEVQGLLKHLLQYHSSKASILQRSAFCIGNSKFNHLILCCPLLPLPSIFLSIRIFSSESALCIRWPKY